MPLRPSFLSPSVPFLQPHEAADVSLTSVLCVSSFMKLFTREQDWRHIFTDAHMVFISVFSMCSIIACSIKQ